MRNINIMLKPASGLCNMRCKYCFYEDISANREVKYYGIMEIEKLEKIIKNVFEDVSDGCNFIFQGGEPTLAGLCFYEKLIDFQKKYAPPTLRITNAIQTNGLMLNDEWVSFFKKNNFLVGISIDGTKKLHDNLRPDASGKGTYNRLMKSIKILEQYGVEYNILTVVTKQLARHVQSVYQQYKKNGWRYLQFIPCLDVYEKKRGEDFYSLTPELYGEFLKKLFDLWYEDISNGDYVYIRYFENLIGIAMGITPESCTLMGHCTAQLVVEADGSAYPCDFYVTDKWKMGNISEDSPESLIGNPKTLKFVETSFTGREECEKCQFYNLCRGGCRRDRDFEGELLNSYYCSSYKDFFSYAQTRIIKLAGKYMR